MKKILVLPDAGLDNPFQHQLVSLLQQGGFEVRTAPSKRFWATASALRHYQPDFIYYDWIQSFTIGRTRTLTLLKSVCFLLEILYVTYIRRIPVIHTLHNVQNHAGKWVRMERWVYYYFLRGCSRVRVYSETTRRKIIQLYKLPPAKVVVVQDVPYHFYYPNTVSRCESREKLNLPGDAFVFLFFGMVKTYKGIESLIEEFSRVPGSAPYLLIAGVGNPAQYGHKIELLAQKDSRIRFHNRFIEKHEVQYYFNAADVVVLPFRNVEHSGSVDLAMSFGKPIITLKTPFMANLLSHQTALLFSNPRELGKIMQTVREEPRLDVIGERNFQLADQVNYRDLLNLFSVD